MHLEQIEYGSLLSYSPRGDSREMQRSRQVMTFVKNDSYVDEPRILMSEWIARTMEQNKAILPFGSLFPTNTILVPVPRSSLMQLDSLWVPQRIANALVKKGFGAKVVPCLKRSKVIRKAATSPPEKRPSVTEHYNTIEAQGTLSPPDQILLVDDIVTRGATFLELQSDC